MKAHYESIKLLSSQYALNGVYRIEPIKYEMLPDGRLILDGDYVVRGGWQDEMPDCHISVLDQFV
jgi:hypothetical protein